VWGKGFRFEVQEKADQDLAKYVLRSHGEWGKLFGVRAAWHEPRKMAFEAMVS